MITFIILGSTLLATLSFEWDNGIELMKCEVLSAESFRIESRMFSLSRIVRIAIETSNDVTHVVRSEFKYTR